MRRSMTPSARQFDGIATRAVSGSGGRTCTLPAGVSGTASAFSITIVELEKPRPSSASHLTAGVIAGWPSAASEAPENATMAVPARKDAMVTCIALISGHIASPTAIPPFALRLTFLDGSDAVASPSLHALSCVRVSHLDCHWPCCLVLFLLKIHASTQRHPSDRRCGQVEGAHRGASGTPAALSSI